MNEKITMDTLNKKITREVAARKMAEQILEKKSIELYLLNQNLEKAITERTTELARALEENKKVLLEKERLLINITHELRTPLHGIINDLDRIQESTAELQEVQKSASRALDSSELLLSLINDLLHFSKIESGDFNIHLKTTCLKDVLASTVDQFKELAQKKNIELKMSWDDKLEDSYIFDPLRLKQILFNLLANAFRHTLKGSVCASARQVSDDSESTHIEFSVMDSGEGISKEHQSQIFRPYFQVKTGEGSGLGLSIVQSLVKSLNGDLSLKSELGSGSTFTCAFRIKKPASTRDSKTISKTIEFSDEFLDLKFLIVDDNKTNQHVTIGMLKDIGFKNIFLADEGLQGQKTYQKELPQLIIMDCLMPLCDGFECTESIRNFEKNNQLKPSFIIGATASVSAEIEKRCRKSGMNELMQKPFRKKDLLKFLKNQIEKILPKVA